MKPLALVALAACARPHGAAPTNTDPLGAQIDKIAGAQIAKGEAVGLTVAVSHHGTVVWAKGYGLADAATHRPADADTLYRIGSLTKQFTAAAIVQLAEAGKLGITDDAAQYVPGIANKVTIEQLLHHISGIPNYTALPGFSLVGATHKRPAELLALVKDVAWEFPPGSRWSYSNTGYVVLGMIIEKVSGEAYAAYLAKHVFPAAGLTATRYCDDSIADPHRATGYASASPPTPAFAVDFSTPYAAGAICSTALDLLRWTTALESGRVVSPAGYRMMTTSHALDRHPYGMGLIPEELRGHRVVWHSGGINGGISELHDYVDDGVTIAVLSNTESGAPAAIERAVAMVELGLRSEAVAITAADLAPFVGVYAMPVINHIAIAIDGDHLVATADGQQTLPLEYRGHDTFAIEAVEALITFVRDPDSHAVVGIRIKQGSADLPGVRQP